MATNETPDNDGAASSTVYTCRSCGKVTRDRAHLCSDAIAKESDKAYACSYCGTTAADPKHVCSPMLANVKYYRKSCGRVTPFQGGVCEPKEIE